MRRAAPAALAVLGLLLGGLCQAQGAPEEQPQEEAKSWHRLVGILQYLQSDYPAAVESHSPSELEEQTAFAQEAVTAARELGKPGEPFLPKLQSIQQRVNKGEDPQGVSRDCAELVESLVQAGGLARSPRRAPDLKSAEQLYATSCAICHGADGRGGTPVAATLAVKPANFQDPERMNGLTPYKAFNTLTFGLANTPMPSFSVMSEQERWDLAFYVFTLRQPPCTRAPPRASLEELATSSDAQLAARYGAEALACLRRRMPEADEERSLMFARAGVEEALELSAAGNRDGARKALLDAYLKGIEPVEPLLRSRNPQLVADLEASFGRVRLGIEKGSPPVAHEGRALLGLIDRARRSQPTAQDFFSVFWLSILILVREGFEATVVIAALLAVLKKMQQREQARVVHAGWISAVVVGGLAFAFGRKVLAGENRELLEGVFSLVAVALLVYAALWLNARSNMRKFMGELRHRMQGALGRGSAVGLFTISFSAMLRESVETAIFLDGLSIDSPKGVAWGIAAGLLVLLGLVLFINRVGYKLPMKPLFNASTVLLLAMALMMLGKGLHALQEVGTLPLEPVPFFRIEALGIFPDAVTLVPQALLAVLAWLLMQRNEHASSSPSTPSPLGGADGKPTQRAG